MYGYIYRTHNKINGKMYIGQKTSSVFLGERYLGSGKYLWRAINKYGSKNFKVELLEEVNGNQEDLDEREIYWISHYNAVESDMYYNLQKGGSGSVKGSKLSEETRRKISENHADMSGSNNPFYGEKHSEETRKKMSVTRKGMISSIKGRVAVTNDITTKYIKKDELEKYLYNGWKRGIDLCKRDARSRIMSGKVLSDITKKKISNKLSGDNNPMKRDEVRRKVSNSMKGRQVSEETRTKISNKLKNRKVSDITKEKLSSATKKARSGTKIMNNGLENKYIKLEEIEYYLSIGWNLGKRVVENE